MARTKGSMNYKNKVLIKIINKLLPNGEVGWEAVATAYFNQGKIGKIYTYLTCGQLNITPKK
jgi:hypothetical protein